MHTKTNRIISIDALRGFALIGILLVNLYSFNIYYGFMGQFYSEFTGANKEVFNAVMYFFGGNSMFIFAFLFGYGAWIQFNNHKTFSQFKGYWFRRMFILFLIGLLHILFLSFGDILAAYAILGMLIPFLIQKSNIFLITLFFCFQLIPAISSACQIFLESWNVYSVSKFDLEYYLHINRSSNFLEILQLRLYDFFALRNEKLFLYMPKELSLFLIGIAAAKMNLAEKSYSKKGFLFCIFSLVIVILFYWKGNQIWPLFNHKASIFHSLLAFSTKMILKIIHGLFYIVSFFILWKLKIFNTLFSCSQYLGRMALTNYLMQSIIAVLIYSGLGLGLYGRSTPLDLLLTTFCIIVFQTIFSYLWLQKYQFGPMEWLWRNLTNKTNDLLTSSIFHRAVSRNRK